MKTRQLFLLLSVIAFASLGMNACKTKSKRSTPAAGPQVTDGDEGECSYKLAGVDALPAAPATSLRVDDLSLGAPLVGNGETLEFTRSDKSAMPDLYIYRGFKRDGRYAFPADKNGVKFGGCSSGECFAGSTFWGSHINPRIPSGPLEVTVWACVDQARKSGAGYQKVAIEGRVYHCGQPLKKTVQNNHRGSSNLEDTLTFIEQKIKENCSNAFDKITSDKNLQAARAAGNLTAEKSILGARAMGVGAFTAECLLEGRELAKIAAYGSQKSQAPSRSLQLANGDDGCIPSPDEDELADFGDYIKDNPGPVTTDPTQVLPPVNVDPVSTTDPVDEEEVAEAPEGTDGSEEPGDQAATVNPDDARREACKIRGERLSELGNGSTEWEPGRNGAQGTCWVVSDEGQRVNVIEPSIAEDSTLEEEEPESSPETNRGGLSTTQKWGLSFLLIGAGTAVVPVASELGNPSAVDQVEARTKYFAELSEEDMLEKQKKISGENRPLIDALEREFAARKNILDLELDVLNGVEGSQEKLDQAKKNYGAAYGNSNIRSATEGIAKEDLDAAKEIRNADGGEDYLDKKAGIIGPINDIESGTAADSLESSDQKSQVGSEGSSRVKKVKVAASDAYGKKSKTIKAGIAAALFGTVLLSFGLTEGGPTIDLAPNEAYMISALNYCSDQLLETRKLSQACQNLLK